MALKPRAATPMRTHAASLRENALCALLAGAGCAALAWLGLYGFAWNDYDNEARPAFEALSAGHLLDFLRLAPAYGGSLVERAPFALLPRLWGGGAARRLPHGRAALSARRGRRSACGWSRACAPRAPDARPRGRRSGVCVANPITLARSNSATPRSCSAPACASAAVLLAARAAPRSRALGGSLLGLAIANKEWALLAVGPVLLALPRGRRPSASPAPARPPRAACARCCCSRSGGFVRGRAALATPASAIFQPWQLWWFLGHHGALVHGAFGVAKPGYRIAPGWAGAVSHPLILAVAARVAAARCGARAGAARRPRQALLALALLLLLRCLLDTWDAVYYPLPFLLALLAWEVARRGDASAVLALAASALVWFSFQWLPDHVSPDAAGRVLPRLVAAARGVARALRLSSPDAAPAGASGARRARAGAQEMTVSALGRRVSTS